MSLVVVWKPSAVLRLSPWVVMLPLGWMAMMRWMMLAECPGVVGTWKTTMSPMW